MTATVVGNTVSGPELSHSRPSGWWGMVLLIATEATLFLLLVATYFYLRVERTGSWPPAPLHDPRLGKPLLATAILLVSSGAVGLAGHAARRGHLAAVRSQLGAAIVLGIVFLVFQGILVRDSLDVFSPQGNAYGSIYYTLIGVHYVHVAAGVLALLWAAARAGRFTPQRHLTLRVTALYWHFVNAIALVVFLVLYLAPRG
jgi:cytochrome c oxidase subunit III